MVDEKAVEAGQLGQAVQLHLHHANVGSFAPYRLDDLAKQGRLYLITDTVSGAASGQIAGQYAIKKVIHSFYTGDNPNLKERLLTAIQQANTDICEENKRHPERRPMAATLAVAWIHDNKLVVANVGDNRAYVVWNQDIELLSQEISLAALNEEAKIDQAEAPAVKLLPAKTEPPEEKPIKEAELVSPRQRLPQALGLDQEVKISLYARRLFAGDVVVLCSGGLTGYVTEQEITRAVNRHAPDEAIKRLMALAGERGNRDPLAISIARVLSSPIALQPPAPVALPAAPTWNDWQNLTMPISNNHTKPVAQAATTAMPPINNTTGGRIPLKNDFTQKLEPILQTAKEQWKAWGWQSYVAALLLLLVICGAPLLVWRYLLPETVVVDLPFLGDVEASITTEDEASNQVIEEAALKASMPASETQAEATVTATLLPPAGPTGALVAGANSPIATPQTTLITPALTATVSSVQTDTQTTADSIIILTTPTPTPLAVPTITLPANCENRARFFRDVTIPDGTQFSPGESFEKVWLLLNAQTCPWGPGYTIRFMGGDLMGGPRVIPLLEVVEPETNGEIKVPLVAPAQMGRYRGEWQLHDLQGEPFGPIMYLEIEVVPPDVSEIDNANLTTLYDFVKNVSDAVWTSGDVTYTPQAATISESLELPEQQGLVASGVAQLRGNEESPGNVLLTYPHPELGAIQGVYQVDTPLQPTDTLVANMGFPKLSILSDDGVTFEVTFKPDDGSAEWVVLSETVQYRDSPIGKVQPLTNIKPGQTGSFTLRVLGGDSLNQDWAIWIDLRLVRP